MKFGICAMADIDEIGFYSHAENLGYDSVWATDSQMLFSDCYAVLALAAERTTRLRLGTAASICGTRIPPVHVAAMATLNRLAPGRVHLAIGTGNTAMRSMGQRPMRIHDYAEYLRVLRALLHGEVVDYEFNGVRRSVKMLMHEFKYMNLEPRIPLYVSGFGPRAMGLAGQYGDGPVFAIPPRGVPVGEAMAHVRQGAARAGRQDLDGFLNCALVNIALLEPGEPADSERIIRTIGPNAMASVYYFYDEVHEKGIDPPPSSSACGTDIARSSRRPRPSTGTSAPTSTTTRAFTPARRSSSAPSSSAPPASSAPRTSLWNGSARLRRKGSRSSCSQPGWTRNGASPRTFRT